MLQETPKGIFNTDELDWIRVLHEDTGSCFGKTSVKKKKKKSAKKFFLTDLNCQWKKNTKEPKMWFWKIGAVY